MSAPEVQPIKTNFTAGELSPRLMGRVDLSRYFNGCRTLENFIVMPHGGIIARPGSRHVCEVKDSSKPTKLISFEFSETESYILEFGDQYIRFFSNNGQVVETAKNITGVTQANPAVVTSAGHGYSNGDHVWIAAVAGMTELNGRRFTVANATANTFELSGVDSTAFGAYVSGGTVSKVYEKTSPYSTTDIFELQVAQSADVMYIVHRSHAPRKLSRTAHTNWTLATPSFTGVTFSTLNNYPGAVAFHEERLWFAGTNAETQTLWGSKSGDYENFTIGANPDDALKYTISSDQVNSIRWMSAGKVLTVGTIGGEFNLSSNDNNDAITPDNVKISRETTHGSALLRPVRVSNAVIFVQRAKRKMREFTYNFEQDSFIGADLTILSEHIIRSGVKDLAYQQEPNGNIWIVRNDGQLAVLTYQKDQQVFGWSRQILGGSYSGGAAVVESVGVIPDDNEDQVWLVVKRTINGSTKRYIEYLTEPFYGETEAEKKLAVQMDSSVTYNGAPVTTVAVYDHLIGQSVVILADGKVKPAQIVPANGKITLTEAASIITIGLSYTPKVRTVNFEPGNPKGTSQGKIGRVSAVAIRFYQTLGGFAGYDADYMDEINFSPDGVTMNQSPAIFTGDRKIPFPKGHASELWVQYEQRQPLPVTILSMMPEYSINP